MGSFFALLLFPTSVFASNINLYLLGRQAINNNDINVAEKLYNKILKQHASSFFLNHVVMLRGQAGSFDNFYPLTKILLTREPNNLHALFLLSIFYIRDQQASKAIPLLHRAIKVVEKSSKQEHLFFSSILQWALLAEGYDEPVYNFLAKTEQQRNTSEILLTRAFLYTFLDEKKAESKAYERALSQIDHPTQRLLAQWLYAWALRHEHPRKARKLLKNMQLVTPLEEMLSTSEQPFSTFFSKKKQHNRLVHGLALTLYTFAIRFHFDGKPIPALDTQDSLDGRFPDALFLLQAALFLTHNTWKNDQTERAFMWMLLGDIKKEQGYLDAAQKAYGKISQKSVPFFQAQKALISLSVNKGDIREITALLMGLQMSFPHHTKTWEIIAETYRILDQKEKAIKYYEKAMSLCLDYCWKIQYEMVSLLYDSSHWSDVRPVLFDLLEQSRRHAIVLNFLGYGMLENENNHQQAMLLIKEAYSKSKDVFILDSLAWGHYCLKNYDKAVQYLEYAITIYPISWEINNHLGDSLWMLGYPVQARYSWRNALMYDPPKEIAIAISKKKIKGLTIVASCVQHQNI